MSNKDFFVILNHPNGGVVPMTRNDDGDMGMYETEEEATKLAEENPLGENFGFEVFELGRGL